MKKFLKITSLLMVFVMLAAFAACGKAPEKTPEETPTGDEVKTPAVKVIDVALTSEQYAFGVDKDQPELLEKTNAFIKKIMADGTFDDICNKYFGDGEPTAVYSAKLDPTKDQLVVATNAEFAPFEYKEGDAFYGIDMEIADLLAKELGKELVINDMQFDSVCLSVGEHTCDIAMAGLTINEERTKSVTFTDSYYEASQKLIVKGDDTTFDACKDAAAIEKILKGFDDKTIIGYQNGTTGQYYVLGDADWGFDGYAVTGKGFVSGALATQDLLNGNVDLVVIDAAPAERIVENFNAK